MQNPKNRNSRKSLAFHVFSPMAQLSLYAPKGRHRLVKFFLGLASNNNIAASIYGPAFHARWHDGTFLSCVYGYYGTYFSDFLKQLNEPFSFIDIGANIGLYSLIAARNKKCKACYAFEPNAEIFGFLQRNIALNNAGKVECVNAAISATEGLLRFNVKSSHSGGGHLDSDGDGTVRAVDRRALNQIARIDKYLKVVKIDVEGHEPTVIAELIDSEIAPLIKNIYFEVNENWYNVTSVTTALERAGFTQTFKNGDGTHYDLMFEYKNRRKDVIRAAD
jgi:FkbM family methyltransferase